MSSKTQILNLLSTWSPRQQRVDSVARLERLQDALGGVGELATTGLAIVESAALNAPYLSRLLLRDPERILRVSADSYVDREKPLPVITSEMSLLLKDCQEQDDFNAVLRRFRGDTLVRLGTREIQSGYTEELGRELANLASVSLNAAISFHNNRLSAIYGPPLLHNEANLPEKEAAFVIFGMGKLGGEELNFASDIDIIYAYESDHGSAQSPEGKEITIHEYFTRLCRAINESIGAVTADDIVFRIDLRLRPEGSQGPIANSMASIERYYENWGRPWERQAWLKARPCAGDLELGKAIESALQPFIFPRSTSPRIIQDVSGLNQKIKAEFDRSTIEQGFDVKNGEGGIREIEFFVQALQLIHAGRNTAIRSKSTIEALDQLFFAGLITETEQAAITKAYHFLRHVEHVLQLQEGQQTQKLPGDPEALEIFAERAGFNNNEVFIEELKNHTDEVARIFSSLGNETTEIPGYIYNLLSGILNSEEEMNVLSLLGFRWLDSARHELDIARRKPLSPFSPTAFGAAARVAPTLLLEISKTPIPDQTLRFISDLISKRGSWSSIWSLFDQNPTLMRLIVSLFGTSEYLSKSFVNHPEMIDRLIQKGQAHSQVPFDELRTQLTQDTKSLAPDDDEGMWNRLANFKQTQILRIGLADIGRDLDPIETSTELSNVADICVQKALSIVTRNLNERYGTPQHEDGSTAHFAIFALGKYGGQELGYASDLDLIFVYSENGETTKGIANVQYMSRLAQRLMHNLQAIHAGGQLYEVDTRLRPSGSQGLLVSSLSAWKNYHMGEAQLWERQALIKIRAIAGDSQLGQSVETMSEHFVYGDSPGQNGRETIQELASYLSDMRNRMIKELTSKTKGLDLKVGRGGLQDVEFATQFIQLAYGHKDARLRKKSTLEALGAAAESAVVDPNTVNMLADGYRFLRHLQHRIRVVHDRGDHHLPKDTHERDILARRAGFADANALDIAYQTWTKNINEAYKRIMGL